MKEGRFPRASPQNILPTCFCRHFPNAQFSHARLLTSSSIWGWNGYMAACHLIRHWNPPSPHSLASYLCVIPPASYPPDRPFCSALFHSHQRVYYQIKCRAAVVDLSNYSATLLGFDQPCLLLARAYPPIHLGTPAHRAHLASCSTPEYWFSNIIWRTWWAAAHHKIHPLL